ncbi:MAG TPA: hypothetical protein VM120_13615 [Bryobacteraceae bacterium]|nr:hypothetical protein [Bryobacteraceae bacterium]
MLEQPIFIQGHYSFEGKGLDAPLPLRPAAMRYFPVAAKGELQVQLAVVEDLPPDTVLEIRLAAPTGVSGLLVLDIGLVAISGEKKNCW